MELPCCVAPAFEGKRYLLAQGWSGPRALEMLQMQPPCTAWAVRVGRSCLLEPPRAQPLTDQSGTQHRGIFRLVERIHPWKCPGAICAPWDLMGRSCPPQPQLLGFSPAFRCLCDPFGICRGMGSRSGEQIHFQSNGVLSFFGGFTLCASSQHTVPRGARHALHGSTTSLFPPSLPFSLSVSLSVPRNLILSRNGVLNGINEPLWQRFQPMALSQPSGWEWMGSGGEGEGARLGLVNLLLLCIDQLSGHWRGSEH